MCEMYVKADPIAYESRSRSVRIHGVVTSIRLENLFWDILARMAEREQVTTNHLIATFHDEIQAHRGDVSSFASFLRVTCLRFVSREGASAMAPAAQASSRPVCISPLLPARPDAVQPSRNPMARPARQTANG